MDKETKKEPKKAIKPTAAEKELRVSEIHEMLLAGLKRYQIIQNCSMLEWNLTARCIDGYIADATALIASELDKIRPDLVSKLYSQYQFLYKRMVNMKDYRGAMMALDRMCQFVNINKHILPADEDAAGGMPALSISFEVNSRKRNEYQDAEVINEGNIGIKQISS